VLSRSFDLVASQSGQIGCATYNHCALSHAALPPTRNEASCLIIDMTPPSSIPAGIFGWNQSQIMGDLLAAAEPIAFPDPSHAPVFNERMPSAGQT
jgi:hypothetical protein